MDYNSKTSMEHLYAVGETSCNGVHGKNRLASNSLLESLVFAKRAAKEITEKDEKLNKIDININLDNYKDYTSLKQQYKEKVLKEVERNKKEHERAN